MPDALRCQRSIVRMLTGLGIAALTACSTVAPPPAGAPSTGRPAPGAAPARPAAPATPPAASPAAAAPATTVAAFSEARWDEVPGWRADRVADAWPALLQSCRRLGTTHPVWAAPCAAAAQVDLRDPVAAHSFVERHLTPWRVRSSDGSDTGLVTGYYEPLIEGSLQADERFRFPVFAPPDDLLIVELSELYPELRNKRVRARIDGRRVVPYYPRAEIEAGKAPVRGKELAWVADPLDLFFLQVQGSGRIRFADGSALRVGYADQNGHPYRAIGKVLVERGELSVEQASMQGIRDWAGRNPERLNALLDENPSYVFFRILPPNPPSAPDGPLGALGVPLSAGRSVAVDRTQLPLGAPLFLVTERPSTGEPLRRLALAQDTGGAIRGPLRVDFFWGFGEEAAQEAGRMRQPGQLWLIWPRAAAPPAASG